MGKRKEKADANQVAKFIVDAVTGEQPAEPIPSRRRQTGRTPLPSRWAAWGPQGRRSQGEEAERKETGRDRTERLGCAIARPANDGG